MAALLSICQTCSAWLLKNQHAMPPVQTSAAVDPDHDGALVWAAADGAAQHQRNLQLKNLAACMSALQGCPLIKEAGSCAHEPASKTFHGCCVQC